MIGQYLPNNNEKSYSAILQKILHLNTAYINEALLYPSNSAADNLDTSPAQWCNFSKPLWFIILLLVLSV
jgi:hypothetical protein